MVNKYFEEFSEYFNGNNSEQEDGVKWYYIVPSASLALVLVVVIVLLAKKYICSRNQKKIDRSSIYTSSITDTNSSEYIYRHVYQNHKNPIYLVPYSALPENFDFSRSDITVRGDYIILRDLHVLEQPIIRPPSIPTTPTTPTIPTVHFYSEGYQRQPPYNPNIY